MAFLGGQVQGGGLRLVIPPLRQEGEPPVQTEVRIESFLKDPKKLFIQVTMAWPQPMPPTTGFDPGELVRRVYDFASSDVVEFLSLKG